MTLSGHVEMAHEVRMRMMAMPKSDPATVSGHAQDDFIEQMLLYSTVTPDPSIYMIYP